MSDGDLTALTLQSNPPTLANSGVTIYLRKGFVDCNYV